MAIISTYKLYINSGDTIDVIEFGKSVKSDILDKKISYKQGSSVTKEEQVMLSVLKCSFDLRMFASGHVTIELCLKLESLSGQQLEVSGLSLDDIRSLLQGARIQLDYVYRGEIEQKAVVVASNYFVYKVNAMLSSSDNYTMAITLDTYSVDKLLDIQPFTRAYTAQKLSKIIDTEVNAVNSGMASKSGLASSLKVIAHNHLNVLQHEYTNKTIELIMPYLVQYNETFYSFLRRVCARTGEFLYFEDGQLNYGLNQNSCVCIDARDAGYKSVSTTSNTDMFNSHTINDWHRNGNKEFEVVEINKVKKKILFPNSEYVNEHQVGNDDFNTQLDVVGERAFLIEFLTLGSFTKGFPEAVKPENIYKKIFNVLSIITSATDLTEAVGLPLVESFVAYPIAMLQKQIDDNDGKKGRNMIDAKAQNYNFTESEQKDSKKISHFSTVDSVANDTKDLKSINLGQLTEELYTHIGQAAKLAQDREIIVDLDNYATTVKLGSEIKRSQGAESYLVTSIIGTVEVDETNMVKCSRKVTAVPKAKIGSEELWLPTSDAALVIKAQGPMIGYVTQNKDPFRQGRVRVRMSWQSTSDKDATPWVRVAMPMAGAAGTLYTQPAVDDEVLVDFENGNMERPYVRGSLFNADNKLEYTGELTRAFQSGKGTGLYIEDETFNLSDWLKLVSPLVGKGVMTIASSLNDKVNEANKKSELPVGAKVSLKDYYGFYNITMSSKDRTVDISSPLGKVSINAFTGITIKAPNGDINIEGKNVNIKAGNRVTIKSGTNVGGRPSSGRSTSFLGEIATILLTVVETIIDSALGSKVLDLSLVRSFYEIFFRPVNGTLQIHSNRHLALEAGWGNAEIPYDSIKATAAAKHKNVVNAGYPYYMISSLFKEITDQANSVNKAAIEAYNEIVDFVKYNVRENNEKIDVEEASDIDENTYLSLSDEEKCKLSLSKCKNIFSLVKEKDGKFVYEIKEEGRLYFCPVPSDYLHTTIVIKDHLILAKTSEALNHNSVWVKSWLANVDKFGNLLCNYKNAMRGSNLKIKEAIEAVAESQAAQKLFVRKSKIRKAFDELLQLAKGKNLIDFTLTYKNGEQDATIPNLDSNNFDINMQKAQGIQINKLYYRNAIAYLFIAGLHKVKLISYVGDQELLSDGTYAKNEPLPEIDSDIVECSWNDFLSKLVPYFDDNKEIGFGEAAKDKFFEVVENSVDFDKMKSLDGIWDSERDMWDATTNPGSIVMSSNKGTLTTRLDSDGDFRHYENASIETMIEAFKVKE